MAAAAWPAASRSGKDVWGHNDPAADLTSGMLRGGQRPLDIYRRIYAGINGTPMPAFKDAFAAEPDTIWHLTHYVLHLADQRRRGVQFKPDAEPAEQRGDAECDAAQTSTPDAAASANAPTRRCRMSHQRTSNKSLTELRARVRELEGELAAQPADARQVCGRRGYYTAYYATTGFLLGGVAAMSSLLFNVIGSLLFEKNPLELIRVYLTFPLGEQALELRRGRQRRDPGDRLLPVSRHRHAVRHPVSDRADPVHRRFVVRRRGSWWSACWRSRCGWSTSTASCPGCSRCCSAATGSSSRFPGGSPRRRTWSSAGRCSALSAWGATRPIAWRRRNHDRRAAVPTALRRRTKSWSTSGWSWYFLAALAYLAISMLAGLLMALQLVQLESAARHRAALARAAGG